MVQEHQVPYLSLLLTRLPSRVRQAHELVQKSQREMKWLRRRLLGLQRGPRKALSLGLIFQVMARRRFDGLQAI